MRSNATLAQRSRRDFLKTAALGGAAVALPSVLSGCKLGENRITAPALGNALVFDFDKADIAYFQVAYCLKQLQVDLFTNTVATLSSSNLTAAEQALFTEIKNHEIIHRETLRGVIGAANDFTITPYWRGIDFKSRVDAVQVAQLFEDVSSGMYNGMVQNLATGPNIAFALSIVSVEARHSAALRDDIAPKSGGTSGFAPAPRDNAYLLSSVATWAQQFLTDVLQFRNAPAGI